MNSLPGFRGNSFPVRKVIGAHIDEHSKTFYQVEWEPSWEPAENLKGCETLIQDFWVRNNPIARVKQEPVDQISTVARKRYDSNRYSTAAFGKTSKGFGLTYPPRRTSRIGTTSRNDSHRFIEPLSSYSPTTSGSMAGYLTRRRTPHHSVSKSDTYQFSLDGDEDFKTPSCSYSAHSESDSRFSSERGSISEDTASTSMKSFLNDRVLPPMNLISDKQQQKQEERTSTSSDNSRNLRPFSCHVCSFRACEKYNLLRHYDNRHSLRKRDVNIVYPCPVCQRTFKGKTYLITHLETHAESISKPYRCSICQASYDNVTDLERHHLSHEFDLTTDPGEEDQDDGKPKERTSLLQCQKCSLGFDSLESLQRHQRRHIETIGTGTSAVTTVAASTNQAFTFKPLTKKPKKNGNIKGLKRKPIKENKAERKHDKAKFRKRLTTGPEFLNCPYCSSQFSNKNFNGITNLNIHLLLKHKNTIKAKPRTPPSQMSEMCQIVYVPDLFRLCIYRKNMVLSLTKALKVSKNRRESEKKYLKVR
ncbi:uncharacterized protein [Clytia hemisphaerica]